MKQAHNPYNLAIVGLILTAIGLASLFFVPVIVGVRVRQEFARIDKLESSQLAIAGAMAAARQSDTLLMHLYMVPGDTRGRYAPEPEYRALQDSWRNEKANPNILPPLDKTARESWLAGSSLISQWIDRYLSKYATGIYGGVTEFEKEEALYRSGIDALQAAKDEAANQQTAIERNLRWLNKAQITIGAPMAIICFVLAFVAWTNVTALQKTWQREREVSGRLEVAVQESNHRIKNNLQIIGALIDMQLQDPGLVVPKASLEAIMHQVRAVAAVHDFLSHELRSEQVNGDLMLRRLVDLTASPIGLIVHLETETMALAVKQATAIALIANELLINSNKHGATEARMVMKRTGLNAHLRVTDNGPGFPLDFDSVNSANLGLALVDTLTRHDLQGELSFSNNSGAQVEVTFPLAPSV